MVDDQHPVDGLRDLREEVARDEHRAAGGGEILQEGAKPANAGGVEAVRGLVENQ